MRYYVYWLRQRNLVNIINLYYLTYQRNRNYSVISGIKQLTTFLIARLILKSYNISTYFIV